MRNRFIIAAVSVMSAVILSACSGTADKPLKPTLGIEWFTSYEDVKGKMDSYTLLSERENKEQRVPQKMHVVRAAGISGRWFYDLELRTVRNGALHIFIKP